MIKLEVIMKYKEYILEYILEYFDMLDEEV